MPFKSKAQSRAAFGGYLGPVMKQKAATWEDETPGGIKALPPHVGHPGQTATRNRLKQDRADSVRHMKKGAK